MEKAREKEREEWERTRGAGSWVMRFKDRKAEIRAKNSSRDQTAASEEQRKDSNGKGKEKETSRRDQDGNEGEWTAEDILPPLEEVEQIKFEVSSLNQASDDKGFELAFVSFG